MCSCKSQVGKNKEAISTGFPEAYSLQTPFSNLIPLLQAQEPDAQAMMHSNMMEMDEAKKRFWEAPHGDRSLRQNYARETFLEPVVLNRPCGCLFNLHGGGLDQGVAVGALS